MPLEIINIPTEKLLPNPYQPRKQFDSAQMLELADSVKTNGILQPLLVRQINNSDYYEVIAGERRLRASILANIQFVPCIVRECSHQSSALLSVLENIQREDLSFFEEAVAIAHLQNQFGMTQEQIAKQLGKSQSALSNKLRLLKLPMDVRQFIESNGLTERHARALLRLSTLKDVWNVLNVVKEKSLNVNQTEALVESFVTPKDEKHPKRLIIFKDVRIFVNTINKAINTMKQSGIEATTDKTETEDYIEFRVKIPKCVSERTNSA